MHGLQNAAAHACAVLPLSPPSPVFCHTPNTLPTTHSTPSQPLQINPVTVVGLLEVSGAKEGDHVVITAAGSTLSRMLIKAAKTQGIHTIGLVRRQEAVQEIKESTG